MRAGGGDMLSKVVCALAVLLTAWPVPAVYAQDGCLADSVSDFSGIQGYRNWYYGYYDGPFDGSEFHLMTQYFPDWGTGFWGVDTASHRTGLAYGTRLNRRMGQTDSAGSQLSSGRSADG